MSGYFRFPTIHDDVITFVCEDDLWTVPVAGGIARRLTTNLSEVSRPYYSPDGNLLAFTGQEEGHPEVYVMPALGGEARRLTYQGASAMVAGWTPDSKQILYASNVGRPVREMWLWSIPHEGGHPQQLPYGPANHIAFGSNGGLVLGRNTGDPARWKRYRGGTAGRLWIDIRGDGDFQLLLPANGNLTAPMWIADRVYFISDHEGIGNLYSCLPTGEDLQRHTHNEEFYCRYPSTDGKRIVYHAGADLYVYDVATGEEYKVPVEFHSTRTQRQRKFVEPGKYLQEYQLHPEGHSLALTVRGKLFTMGNWEGAVPQHGERDGVRYRLSQWLNDGKRLVTVSDAGGEERIEIHTGDGSQPPVRWEDLDIGHAYQLEVSPQKDQIVLHNHRFELLMIDLETRQMHLLDKSEYDSIAGVSWSPDGRWVAYGFASTERTHSIKICRVETGETRMVTPPEFHDVAPAWDPEGNYLYFLSYREYNPVYDQLQFDLGFPRAMRALFVTLRKDTLNPLLPPPHPLEEPLEKQAAGSGQQAAGDKGAKNETRETKPVEIDFEDIHLRVVTLPYPEGIYGQIAGIPGSKVLLTSFPMEGSLNRSWTPGEPEAKGTLHVYDFKAQKSEEILQHVTSFTLSRNGKTLAYRSANRLRVLLAGQKPEEKWEKEPPSRQSGWINLDRVKVSVVPTAEWRQMYREAWRLQRDYFWTEDMSGVDWQRVYERYRPLLDRVATRSEFSDLMWEMQGELGTSHCYEFGGDYRQPPNYAQGFLGADFQYDENADGYRIIHIVEGDPWDEKGDSPLNEPGINIKPGDVLLAINGQRLTRERAPGELLVNTAEQEIQLTVRSQASGETRTVTVKTLRAEGPLRYREWVRKNREYVHEKTGGKVGYLHIPDMGARGYAEFHRGFLPELTYPGLIVDVRNNGGGHVSPLILEKLARKRVGYDVPRWGKPIPYPYESVMGPMVAVTDERAGSDGDIFSHCFKLMKLGTLIGKRTWGGVIGISPKSIFVDGGLTTQPEYSFWFSDVGWSVENYGTDPDIEVEYRPQDYVAGIDPQLDRAIEEILKQIEENPPRLPDFSERPKLPLPRLMKNG